MPKILIVDDSEQDRLQLMHMLEKEGFTTIEAESGEEGVELAAKEKPKLILMDVVMPGMNGFRAVRAIKKQEALTHIPVIMVTTKGQDTDRIWAMRQGAQAFLTKPINKKELLGKIHEFLRV